jgi:tripeptidyl-peptidase-2
LFPLQPQKGAVFEIPVYVMKPEPVSERDASVFRMENASFPPGAIRRHFLSVPDRATWALFKAKAVATAAASPSASQATSSKFILHTVQLLPMKGVREVEHHKMFSLNDDGTFTYPIAIRGN